MFAPGLRGATLRATSLVAFSCLDALDVVLCYLFGALDRLHGQHWGGCYCSGQRLAEEGPAAPEPPPSSGLRCTPLPAFDEDRSPSGASRPLAHPDSAEREAELLHQLMEADVAASPEGGAAAPAGAAGPLRTLPAWRATSDTLHRREKFLGLRRRAKGLPAGGGKQEAAGRQRGRGGAPASQALDGSVVQAPGGSGEGSTSPPGSAASGGSSAATAARSGTAGLDLRQLSPSHLRWSDCRCPSCTAWQRSPARLFVHVEGPAIPPPLACPPGGEPLATKGPEARETLAAAAARAARPSHPPLPPLRNSGDLAEAAPPGAAAGGAGAIIFIHGFLSSSSFWADTVLPRLPRSVRDTHLLLAPDLLGFGRSPKPRDCHYTVADHVRWIEESVLAPFNVGHFHVVAHSMGCIIGLALAACHLEAARSVTLVAPPSFLDEPPAGVQLCHMPPRTVWPPATFAIAVMSWYEHVGRAACVLLCSFHLYWEPILWHTSRVLAPGRVPLSFVKDFMAHTHHSAWHIFHNTICAGAYLTDTALHALRRAGRPVTLVHGRDDAVCPYALSLELARKHPHVGLVGVPGADHVTVVLGREEVVVAQIRAAVESGGAAPGLNAGVGSAAL